MFEYKNETYTLEDLQVGAKEQGLDFDAYLEGMKNLGMVEKTTDSSTETQTTESNVMDSGSGDGSSVSPEINHPEEYDFQEAGMRQYGFRQEENLVPWLNEKYEGSNVRFAQAKKGQDAVEVLIGNQKEGEGEVFDLRTGVLGGQKEGVFNEIKMHIDRSTNKQYDAKVQEEILNNVNLEDLYLDDTPENRAAFANNIDAIVSPQEPGTAVSIEQRRLSTTGLGQSVAGPLARLYGVETQEADMTGNITLSDGRTVSYESIWNQKEKLKEVLTTRKNQEELKTKRFLNTVVYIKYQIKTFL